MALRPGSISGEAAASLWSAASACPASSAMASAMASAGRTVSATPSLMACCGISGNLAFFGSSTIVLPPAALISESPRVPSPPPPDEQDAAAAVSPVGGQGAEEMVDRHQQAVAVDRRREREPILGDVEELIRRHDVDAVGQDRHAVGRLHHLQRRLTLQQCKQVFLREFGVMDQDDGNAPSGRQPAENRLEGLQGARPGPDAHHDGRGSARRQPCCRLRHPQALLALFAVSSPYDSPGSLGAGLLKPGGSCYPFCDVRQEIRSSGSFLRGKYRQKRLACQ